MLFEGLLRGLFKGILWTMLFEGLLKAAPEKNHLRFAFVMQLSTGVRLFGCSQGASRQLQKKSTCVYCLL